VPFKVDYRGKVTEKHEVSYVKYKEVETGIPPILKWVRKRGTGKRKWCWKEFCERPFVFWPDLYLNEWFEQSVRDVLFLSASRIRLLFHRRGGPFRQF